MSDRTTIPVNEDLDIDQAAAYLGCTTRTLHKRRAQGLGPVGYRIGARLRFTLDELELVKAEDREQRRLKLTARG